MDTKTGTPFLTIYNSFLNRVTSEMYMEMTELDTFEQLQGILLNAIPRFKLPRFDILNYEEGYLDYSGTYKGVESDNREVTSIKWIGGTFSDILTVEEINILSLAMVIEWFIQQLNTTEYTKMKYSGSDFKFTSQANHMAKLKVMIDKYEEECRCLQDTYKRRKRVDTENGKKEFISTLGQIMEVPGYGYKI